MTSKRERVKPARFAEFPDGAVVEVELSEHQPYTGRYGDLRAYDVYLDGVKVGRVESSRNESWGKSGRIRTSYRGSPKTWNGQTVNRVGRWMRGMPTRAEAVSAVVTEHQEGR